MESVKPILLIVGAAIAIGAIVLLVRRGVVPNYRVSISDIPRVLGELSRSSSVPTYAVFMIWSPDRTEPDDVLNIQFSIEDGRPGFDWVLLEPRNIEDENRFGGQGWRDVGHTQHRTNAGHG